MLERGYKIGAIDETFKTWLEGTFVLMYASTDIGGNAHCTNAVDSTVFESTTTKLLVSFHRKYQTGNAEEQENEGIGKEIQRGDSEI